MMTTHPPMYMCPDVPYISSEGAEDRGETPVSCSGWEAPDRETKADRAARHGYAPRGKVGAGGRNGPSGPRRWNKG